MGSRTANQAWSQGLDPGMYILWIVTAELQTANVAYFQRKIQLSEFSAYPDGTPSQLIQISGVLLYCILRFDDVYFGINLPAFRRNRLPPSSW